MHGLAQVKEVTNHFSVDAGYLTIVSPDCLVATAGNRETPLWLSIARIGYSYGAYKIWKNVIMRILRYMSNWRIRNGIISKILSITGEDRLLIAEELLLEYRTIKLRLPSTMKALPSEPITMDLTTRFTNFIDKKYLSGPLKYIHIYTPEIESIINAKIISNQWGEKVSTALVKVDSDKYSTSIIKYIKDIWSLSNEGKVILSSVIHSGGSLDYISKSLAIREALGIGKQLAIEGTKEIALAESGQLAVIEGTAATGVGIPIALLELASMVLLGSIGDTIGRWVSSRQCVVIMPLKVNNLEFSAGIEGHMGAVIGDPLSLSDQWFASIFSSSYDKNSLGMIVPLLMDFILPGADSGWNPDNPSDEIKFPKVPDIQEDSFRAYIDSLNNRPLSNNVADIQYDKNDFKEPLHRTSRTPGQPAYPSDLYNAAKPFEGIPYVWGGDLSNLNTKQGLDCSGFVQAVFRNLGKSIPRTANEQYNKSEKIPVQQLQPGDLVFKVRNGYAYHVGIYAGNNRVMQAPHTGAAVVLDTPLEKFGANAYGRL
jgi:hypothetical protein